MFSALLDQLRRNIGLRLSLWFALIFALSAAALLALVYYLVEQEFERKDQEVILARLKEYATVYQAGGAEALRRRAVQENNPGDEKAFYVNLITPRLVLPIIVPDEWGDFKLAPSAFGVWRQMELNRIPQNAQKDFALAQVRLPDGGLLQVGRSTNNRQVLWQPFRR